MSNLSTKLVRTLLISALAAVTVMSAFAQSNVLKVGDPAPAIQVAKWVKGDAVPSLDKGKIYVVEFWATWCGPCKVSIPHLTELHKKFGDKATFIGVSSFETKWDGVEPFVKSEGDQMDYDVAMDKIENPTDREGFMAKNWMEAAHQPGIPTAFVVDKEGRIAWIGHPMELEQPLAKIVDGTWDRDAAAKAFAKAMDAQNAEANSPARKISTAFGQAMKAKKWDDALADANQLSALDKKYENTANSWKMAVYTESGDAKGFDAVAEKILNGPAKNNPAALNQVAWPIVDPESKLSPRNLELAHSAASKAVDLSERKEPAYIDTLAWAEFWMGNKSKAIDLENEAISKVTGDKSSYEASLKKFQGE
jgi:thiol-disulfide isomerase/thioredoxin